jgi:excisionase family DNA binding protein
MSVLTQNVRSPIDPILPLTAVAEALGLSKKTVERLIARSELRLIRITPRRVGVRRSEVERFIAMREAAA